MTLTLTHFQALLLFALLISLAFAFLSKRTFGDRARYTLWSMLVFLTAALGIAWLMYFFQR